MAPWRGPRHAGVVTIWVRGWYGTGTVYVDDVTVS
jgi:hypothetical protein